MKTIETTDVTITARCDVHLACCLAKVARGAVTVIWTTPGRRQVNVCYPCLDAQIKLGAWTLTKQTSPLTTKIQALAKEFTDENFIDPHESLYIIMLNAMLKASNLTLEEQR